MSERTNKPMDGRKHISLAEDDEVRYWTKELGVTRDELAAVIEQHGDSVAAVRRALDKPHLPKAQRFRPKPRTA